MELQTYETDDSKLEHNDWRFPPNIKTYPLGDLGDEDEGFLDYHKIDRSYDSSTVRFKLLVGNAASANLSDTSRLAIKPDVLQTVRAQRWISDEYEHLWRRDGGGSASLRSHGILTFLLQTPRDGKPFCSLSLVNRERHLCAGFFLADERFSLQNLLSDQTYENRHPKVPRDFAVLPFQILTSHVKDTVDQVQRLSREVTSTEKRMANADITLEDNKDLKLLNRFSLEHIRLQRRSTFESELALNILKYLTDYEQLWDRLWEGGTGYIEDMREKVDQQIRYADQVKLDLDILPRRIKNQNKAIFSFMAREDNKLQMQLAESSKAIAQETRRDNLLNLEMAAATAQVAEEARKDSAAMKTIAVLTLTFLPGTFVASFFSMNGLFQWPNPAEGSYASPYLWIFFVVTIPLTLLVFGLWVIWDKFSQRRHKQQHDFAVASFERELKQRVRSATGTW